MGEGWSRSLLRQDCSLITHVSSSQCEGRSGTLDLTPGLVCVHKDDIDYCYQPLTMRAMPRRPSPVTTCCKFDTSAYCMSNTARNVLQGTQHTVACAIRWSFICCSSTSIYKKTRKQWRFVRVSPTGGSMLRARSIPSTRAPKLTGYANLNSLMSHTQQVNIFRSI